MSGAKASCVPANLAAITPANRYAGTGCEMALHAAARAGDLDELARLAGAAAWSLHGRGLFAREAGDAPAGELGALLAALRGAGARALEALDLSRNHLGDAAARALLLALANPAVAPRLARLDLSDQRGGAHADGDDDKAPAPLSDIVRKQAGGLRLLRKSLEIVF